MKVVDKLETVDETVSIRMYDNGFVVEVSGNTKNNDWATAKILCDSLDKVYLLLAEISTIKRT